jgi:hypothetical protein
MKLKYVAVVFAGLICITVPAWSDTISQNGPDFGSAVQYSQPARFDFSRSAPEYFSPFDFGQISGASDRNLFEIPSGPRFVGLPVGEHKVEFDWWIREARPAPGGNPGNPPATVPVPEPATFVLLATGLLALIGSAHFRSPGGPRASA